MTTHGVDNYENYSRTLTTVIATTELRFHDAKRYQIPEWILQETPLSQVDADPSVS